MLASIWTWQGSARTVRSHIAAAVRVISAGVWVIWLISDLIAHHWAEDGGTYRSPHNAETGYPGSSNPSISRSSFFGANLIDAVHNNTLPISRLNDMVVRVRSEGMVVQMRVAEVRRP